MAAGGVAPGVVAQDGGTAGRRPQEAEQEADRRRLAGTVGPKEAEDLALADREVDVLDPPALAVSLGEADGLDHVSHPGAPTLPARRCAPDYRGWRAPSARAGPTEFGRHLGPGQDPPVKDPDEADPSSTSAGAFAPWR